MHRTRHLLAPLLAGLLVAIALALASAPGANAHRLISGDYAQRSANNYVRYHYCGGGGWSCYSVWVPLYQCGLHSWCWHGVSHVESFLWIKRLRSSSGTVNGHAGTVTGYGEY